MNISLNASLTVHLDEPRHNGFLVTDQDNEEFGILYKNGILSSFQPSIYSPPSEWQKNYKPPFEDWWLDQYDELINEYVSPETLRLLSRRNN